MDLSLNVTPEQENVGNDFLMRNILWKLVLHIIYAGKYNKKINFIKWLWRPP